MGATVPAVNGTATKQSIHPERYKAPMMEIAKS